MRIIGFFTLIFVLITSLFNLWGANLTTEVVTVGVMVLLLSLFSDLESFNFLGFAGKKKIESLAEAKGQDALGNSAPKMKSKKQVQDAIEEPLPLLEDDMGNFLALAFEIERLLGIAAQLVLDGKSKTSKKDANLLTKLRAADFLTQDGVAQVEGIRWLRNKLVHGSASEVNRENIKLGLEVANSLYSELRSWFENI